MLCEDAARLHRTMRKRGPSTVFAVAVSEGGMHYADVDAKHGYQRLIHNHGDKVIGYYNARVERHELQMDVLDAAHEIGLV